MKTIYIDSDFKCYTASADNLTPVETSAFDGKCDTYIEGYRFVPVGSSWTRSDGMVFTGEMISPCTDWAKLDAAQREYEREQLAAVSAQNAELLDAMAAMVEDIYNQDVESIVEG